ncbi:MAG TPA: hypothetical protein DCY25_08190 [Bacteroidales bacterium]|nr:hypothetical protein [Bacteroidales bacterium]
MAGAGTIALPHADFIGTIDKAAMAALFPRNLRLDSLLVCFILDRFAGWVDSTDFETFPLK